MLVFLRQGSDYTSSLMSARRVRRSRIHKDRSLGKLHFNSNASNDDVLTYRYYDSPNRVIQENSQMLGVTAARSVTNEYQGHRRLVRQT